ncbi:MAG: molybdate ABC transporter substrate-binding protein [Proteobacteria bacterium]|nr:molybdate ABC transporter substrate-binding protein [Pseudomonadota bacterium]
MKKILMLALSALCLGTSAAPAAERVLTVFAASSLTDVLQHVGNAYTAETGRAVRGAPADVFVSADQQWMDYLQTRKLIQPATRVDIVSNSLVLIAPADNTLTLKIAPAFALAAALGASGRLSTGDTASVPVGKYAREALMHLGVWAAVQNRLVAADNVRTALNFVARGEAPLGIVYATDAKAEPRVRVVDVFPASSHAPIRYPAAAVAAAASDSSVFLRYLSGANAQAIFTRAGFAKP